jgi:PAS domain S-box-containing protein
MKNGETKMSKIRNSPSSKRALQMGNGASDDATERAKAIGNNILQQARADFDAPARRAEDQRGADRLQSVIEDRHIDSVAGAIGRKERDAELATALLAAIVKSSNDAIYAVDLNGIITFWNQGAEQLYGYTAWEIIGRPVATLAPPECHEMEKGILERLLRGERVENYETRRMRKDGSDVDISLTMSLIENDQGEIIGTSRIARDIAEHKRAEEVLRKSEARFATEAKTMRDIYDSSARLQAAPDLHAALEEILQSSIRLMQADFGNVQLYDADRKVLWLAALHGFSEQFVETFRVVAADDDTACGRAIRGGRRVVIEDVERDELFAPYREVAAAAGYRGVQSTPLYDREGALLGVLSTHWRAPHRPSEQDFLTLDLYARQAINFISRARAEKELRESEERFRSYFQLGLIGMAITSPAKIMLEVNDEICKILGYARDELLKMSWAEMTHPDDLGVDFANFERVMAGEIDGYKLDKRFIHKDGRIIDTTISVKALRTADGAVDHFVSLLEDVTERKRAEEALRESERLTQEHAAELADLHRRKDEFLAMLSHELRNPLSPILNAAHILRLQKDENPLQKQARAVIERQVNQLSRLVNDLLEVSRVITGTIRLSPERLDVRGVVEHAVESARPLVEQRRHRLSVSLPAEPVWLEGDAARLEQVVVNLLNNAAKYTDEGGNIWVNMQPEGDEVTLGVRDTGVGIAPELLPRVFDLFTQADRTPDRSQGGLGIGLSLTQRLVELHRGKIEAHSAGLGRGSEFIVRLPVLPTSERKTDMTSTVSAKQAARAWRILVADDNVDAANMIAMMLQHFGHQTETVYSAQSALEMAVEYQPDFVVLDIGLPGMDGYEVARRLRRIPELKDTRLIAATGYGQDTDRQRSEEAGFDYHLVKPIDPEKLQTVLELLGRLPRSAKFGG